MNFNDYDTQWDFETAMNCKRSVAIFEDLLRDNLTTEQAKLLGNYLFGVNRDYAAAGHLLMEIATPAARFVVRDYRERTAPTAGDGDAQDREYEHRRQEEVDRGAT